MAAGNRIVRDYNISDPPPILSKLSWFLRSCSSSAFGCCPKAATRSPREISLVRSSHPSRAQT
jgi:hypothetical protein